MMVFIFVPDLENVDNNIIPAQCLLCQDKTIIRGSFAASSNYTKYLKV